MSVTDGRRGIFWMDDAVLDEHAKVLGVYGFAVYAILCRRANKDGRSHPSIRRISEDLDISTRQAKRELKKLRDGGYISIKAKDGTSSVYTVLPLPGGGDSQSPGVVPHSHPKEDTVEGSEEANASRPTAKSVPLDKHTTDRMYDAYKAAGFPEWTQEEYGFHLGRVKRILAKNAPDDLELQALPRFFVEYFTDWNPKADAVSTLREMRRRKARDASENRRRPDWERPNPHGERPEREVSEEHKRTLQENQKMLADLLKDVK